VKNNEKRENETENAEWRISWDKNLNNFTIEYRRSVALITAVKYFLFSPLKVSIEPEIYQLY
jgi:hypothetical protein